MDLNDYEEIDDTMIIEESELISVSFDEENVIRTAKSLLKEEGINKICLDELDEAMLVFSETHDLDKAAEILVNDTLYWEDVY